MTAKERAALAVLAKQGALAMVDRGVIAILTGTTEAGATRTLSRLVRKGLAQKKRWRGHAYYMASQGNGSCFMARPARVLIRLVGGELLNYEWPGTVAALVQAFEEMRDDDIVESWDFHT